MFFKFQHILRNTNTTSLSTTFNLRSIHKQIYKMNQAYLRHLTETEQFNLSFHYVNTDLKVNRQFNFCRQLSETVESFLGRLTTNIEKIVNKKNKKKPDTYLDSGLNVSLLVNGDKVTKETKCGDVFVPNNSVTLKILDKTFNVIINSPWVETIALPTSILANFPTYPTKFDTVFTQKQLSKFTWSKSRDKINWVVVGEGYIYTPSNEDIDSYLKFCCKPKNDIAEGPEAEVVSIKTVEASPGYCPFEARHEFTKNKCTGSEFRVVSYNILADLYCDSDHTREVLFPYCPPYALTIDYRKQLFLKEIIGYNGDIMCLQEVDSKVFKHDLEPILSHLNYGTDFALKGGEVAEGLAFFYNKSRFDKLESHRIVFSEHISTEELYSDIWEKIATNEKLSERIIERTTTMQVNVVKSLENNEILVVANIHLYFHPDADHIRLLHGGLAIRYLENFFKERIDKFTEHRLSLIFCGDFNSVPECGIYKLFTTGFVPQDFIDYQSNKEEAISNVELRQSFKLDSACGTPKYTNFTAGFAACLDYIYYDKDNLQVSQVVPLPSHEELTQHTALPSIVFPSDHIALISDLKWL